MTPATAETTRTATPIPILDLTPETDALWDQLQAAVCDVMRSGRFILGPQVQKFESEVAEYLGVRHAVGCNSGTDALVIALRAIGVSPGDEVITTPFTFFATAESISSIGAVPVFVDIDPETFNIDPAEVERAITPRTRAIVPVHLFGQAAEMDALGQIAETSDLAILEDAAQAFGARYGDRRVGTLGTAGAFSFFPSKNLGAFGDGGLIATDRDDVADAARLLRAHGGRQKYQNEILGYNSRLDEMQAAVLRVKLPHIDPWNEGRRRVAALYDQLLAEVPWIETPAVIDDADCVFHQYTVRIIGRNRDEVQSHLKQAGIGTMIYYPVPVHKLPVYSHLDVTLPRAEHAAGEVLSLPIGPSLSEESVHRVVDVLREL